MTPAADWTAELEALLERLIDGEFTAADRVRLNALLAGGEAPRRYYRGYMKLHAGLEWRTGEGHRQPAVFKRPAEIPAPAPLCAPIVIHASPACPPPFSSVLGGWLFSYGVATLLTGVAILGAWAYKVSHDYGVAKPSPSAVETFAGPEKQPDIVGQITAAADCRWADSEMARSSSTPAVALGRKYDLAAGLLEITYQTGARVILQGPCTYEVDSPSSGFLSLGKLTAQVEKSELQEPESKSSDPSSLILHPSSLFSVRTPTATVTDLSTAFGVEVTREGHTDALVFQGSIRVTSAAGGADNAAHERVCREGEAVHVGAGDTAVHTVPPEKNTTALGFVRVMPLPQSIRDSQAYAGLVLSLKPAAYYRMERPGSENDRYRVVDSSPGGWNGELRLGGDDRSLYMSGRFGDALCFRGPETDDRLGDRVIVPDYPKATGDRLTVSAWVIAVGRPEWAMIASNWGVPADGRENSGQFHLGLFQDRGDLSARVTQRDGRPTEVREGESNPLPLYLWQHVALVADGGTLRLYRNGKQVAVTSCLGVLPNPPVASLGIGCRTNKAGTDGHYNRVYSWYWRGGIDELAIFNQALPPQAIEQLYLGKPSQPQNAETPAKRR